MPHVNVRRMSAGWLPVPDLTVTLSPLVSVTVSVTLRSIGSPVALLGVWPHVSVNENVAPLPLSVFCDGDG